MPKHTICCVIFPIIKNSVNHMVTVGGMSEVLYIDWIAINWLFNGWSLSF